MKNSLLFIFLLLNISSCNKLHYDVFYPLCVDQNSNAFKPRENTWNKRVEYSYMYYFDPTCVYSLNTVDQLDWNKLGGFSFHPFTNHENSFMVGWRYLDGHFQLAPYQHLNGKRILHDPGIEEINPFDLFKVFIVIDYNKNTVYLTMTTEYETYYGEFVYDNMNERTREIFPWFGGNNSATHPMCIFRKQI